VTAQDRVPARLLALRLQGFKSFAERTLVEFGGGISAVVGPNGSGKSNLADALRWAFGEQGRALRSRKAEDVIWGGSEKRSALGMADVTLLLDNADGLLPVEYQVLELGRRLYRSGENEYQLNKQRVRLRDLVDLLDAAHLADNAFLFIGQGMVDQALSLRPEERRPLFEEVAGVRRHERRKRKAEEQLAESEANLARVEDIIAELRPQVRRLAAQAEQNESRVSAADELVDALLVASHARWYEAARRVAAAGESKDRAVADADRAMSELQAAEERASALAGRLRERSALEQERRAAHDAALAASTRLQLADGRLASELEAIARDRQRLGDDRAAAEADLAQQRRILAQPVPAPDIESEAALSEAERALTDALAELATIRAERHALEEERAAVRRAAAAREAERETARRRLAAAQRQAAQIDGELARARDDRIAAEAVVAAAHAALEGASTRAERAVAAREAARSAVDALEGERQAAVERRAAAAERHATQQARLDALEARLAEEEARGIARAARSVGGRRLDDDLDVDPAFRAAVEIALSDAARAYLVDRAAVPRLAEERGMLVVGEVAGEAVARPDAAGRRFLEQLGRVGGGTLDAAVRRDGLGVVRTLLGRAAWVPDLATALSIQDDVPAGWVVVPRDGSALLTDRTISLGRADGTIERRAEAVRLAAAIERLASELEDLEGVVAATSRAAAEARESVEAARAEEARAVGGRRHAEEDDRVAARRLESLVREIGWLEAQAARAAADVEQGEAALTALAATLDGSAGGDADQGEETTALAAWEHRVTELRSRRDRLAERHATADAARREIEATRARADAAGRLDEERIAQADREAARLAERERATAEERDALRAEVAVAASREREARAALDELRAADSADRDDLAVAERDAAGARERLRAADDRLRVADHAELEARLGLESLRERLLVEIAGLGSLGADRLAAAATGERAGDGPDDPDVAAEAADPADAADVEDEAARLGVALGRVAPSWEREPPSGDVPSPGRLAALRRRYHELGAGNPFAADEYEELRTRLEGLERQDEDLRTAITRTRDLIAELNAMIADQFRTTFTALEAAFDARFQQLFGGGFAKLSLTDPTDLASTGIDITARPPGKKAQALAMLSGGERALTAVALLFAMLEIRPVPFCVLDEVDAALDEANIGRFADALRGLAHQTQFIVITHNRGTIEAADALYGVTVGDDSVSRVISLRLDEATALADQREELAPAG
jgi:chromosome segregation protein